MTFSPPFSYRELDEFGLSERSECHLDTNTRSWSDGAVGNTCSMSELEIREGFGPSELRSVESPVRPCPERSRQDHRVLRDVRRHVPSAASRPRGGDPGQGPGTSPSVRRPQSCQPRRRLTGLSGGAQRRRTHLLVGIVVAAIAAALALPWGGAGGHPLATSGPARAGAPLLAHEVYVVQPGDTLWDIAQRLDPGGDPRSVEARLESEAGGDDIQPGERLVLP